MSLSAVELRFGGHPSCCLVTILTELYPLIICYLLLLLLLCAIFAVKKYLKSYGRLSVPVTVHREQSVKREKPTRCNNQMFIINFCLNMFRASLCPSSGEQRPCARILQRSAPQPLPTTSRRTSAVHHMQKHTVFVLQKMGIMMLETCLDRS